MDIEGDAWQTALSWAVLPAGRAWQRAAGSAFSRHGISLSLAAPMLVIARLGNGVNQKAVAEELGINTGALVRALDALEEKAVLERRTDANDRRNNTLHLTRSGRKMVAQLEAILDELRRAVLAGLSQEDGAAALRVLAHLDAQSRAVAALLPA